MIEIPGILMNTGIAPLNGESVILKNLGLDFNKCYMVPIPSFIVYYLDNNHIYSNYLIVYDLKIPIPEKIKSADIIYIYDLENTVKSGYIRCVPILNEAIKNKAIKNKSREKKLRRILKNEI